MDTEWLIAGVTSVRPPTRAERGIFGLILDVFWPIWPLLWSGSFFCDLSHNNFTQRRLMKIEWLIADVTSTGSPTRAEHDICG